SSEPRDAHWTRFFEHVSEAHADATSVGPRERRLLMEAYHQRGRAGLPENLSDDARCLLDRQGRLFSLSDLREGLLVEGDYPALVDVLAATGSRIGVADLTERSRSFFLSLDIRPLTSIAGPGTPAFGAPTPAPHWFKVHHRDRLLDLLRRPLFAKALHE